MMGVNKKCREINQSKNYFVNWLKQNKAENIDIFEGSKMTEWDYYRHVSAFVKDRLISVYFMMWNGDIKISYSDEENKYELSIQEFKELIN